MSALEKLRFTLAQINPSVGDLDGNLERIISVWTAQAPHADLVIFPEMVLTGYPPEDLLHKSSFIDACENRIEGLIEKSLSMTSAILIGAPYRIDHKLYNAALLIDNGKLKSVTAKHHLPNYGVFDEKRYFTPSSETKVAEFRGTKLGVMICEDMWFENIANDLKKQGAEILISLNGSPFEIGKLTARELQAHARVNETDLPLIYVNQIGGQDDLVFDGTSFALDAKGTKILTCNSFEEDICQLSCHPEHSEESPLNEELLFRAASLGLKDYMRKTGQKKILIGLSGGVDSALAAAIAVDAIGAENINAVMMPSEFTSQESLDDASLCAKNLGITYEIAPIKNMVETFIKDQPDTTGLAHENLQSRLRGVILMTKSNMTGAMVVTTGNKSEMAMGYATLYGDMCGGYNPLKDMYKVEVYKICDWYNQTHDKKIPQNIITKAPSAELRPDQKDQDSLPPYNILDAILECLIEKDLSVSGTIEKGFDKDTVEKVARLLKIAQYKRNQSAPGPKLTQRAFARERRYPISNGYKG
ncbi:MAG: NAD+ synthase [Pseudobdellovibrionaceae bacterium]|jgi:NAD+ synthase|nr:NAD+ synthase [Pseudobdellovibrionaceae bacterium]